MDKYNFLGFRIVIFLIFNISVITFKYFKSFEFISNDLLLVTEEGIIKYNLDSGNQKIIISANIIRSENDLEFISFAQFPSNEGGFILCRIKEYIYILSEDGNSLYKNLTISEISNSPGEIIPYINKDNKKCIIFACINKSLQLILLMYEINSSQELYSYRDSIKDNNGEIIYLSGQPFSCVIMYSKENENILTCYVINNQYYIDVVAFDLESNFLTLYLIENEDKTKGISGFNSIIQTNKNENVICYIETKGDFKCLKYNSIEKEWSKTFLYMDNCIFYQRNKGIIYVNEEQEYLLYCYKDIFNLEFMKLDKELNIKYIYDNKSSINYKIEKCYSMYASSLIYNKLNKKYYISSSCIYNGDSFSILELTNLSNNESEINNLISDMPKNFSSPSYSFHSSLLSFSSNYSPLLSTSIKNYTISSLKYTPFTSLIFTSSLIQSSILSTKSSLSITNNLSDPIDIQFYFEGDINKAKINETKEEIETKLNNIINKIEIGKKYEINGKDFNISISPVDVINTFTTSYVEFSICEQILRKQYNISKNEILTIIQIEINRMNEKAITNQIEYEVYNEQKIKLDLSYCKDVKIKVNYQIKNSSLLNKTMISSYSQLGIDIFNKEDLFFNDICYPFSNENSDIILNDRVLDIYQNYSLCENECTYEQIEIESMLVTCSCEVKTEINIEVSEPVFGEIIKDSFRDSNFGVIKCYNLVFSFKNKGKNIGFLLFLFLVIFNIILFIKYLICGIKDIILFVYKEMEKNNYISVIHHSPIKKINKNFIKNKNEIKILNNNQKNKNKNINEKGSTESLLLESNIQLKKSIKSNKLKINKKIIPEIKINKSIMLFNYNYKYLNINNELLKNLNEQLKNNKYKIRKNKTFKISKKFISNELNKNFPGYYNLIQIDANNKRSSKPPNSKYILDNYNYEYAIKYDKRDFWRIYFIFLLSKENILNTFFFKSQLEIQSLRLSLFIFNYSCDFALNALFYFNENISDKYHYKGENLYWYILVNNLTISIFSTIFSYLLVRFLGLLTNSKDSIESLFRNQENLMRKNENYKVHYKEKRTIYEKLSKIYKILKIKILFYIIIEFILLLFFFYFITAFCEVYNNTQISWLSDSIVSFLLSIIIEFLISFFYSLLYMVSVKYRIKFLYNILLFLYRLG